jgi:hypothetical protein
MNEYRLHIASFTGSKLKKGMGEQGLSSGHGVGDYLVPRMKIYEMRVGGSGYKVRNWNMDTG